MTIDEAIKHSEEVAEEHTNYNCYGGFESCDECAKEHRQLVNWLKELKQLREQEKTGHWIYGYTFPDGQYRKCSVCKELIKVVANDGNFCGHCGAEMDERGRKE